MKAVKKYKFECILFFIEAICMILELIASRVLSPYFGNSNIVWTSVIGIILLSSSLGNYLGGKIADREGDLKDKLKNSILIAAVFIFIIAVEQTVVLEIIDSLGLDLRLGAVISAIVLFFAPNLFLGFSIPIVLKMRIENIEETGNVSGRIYAISTLGGIVGTFFGGFVLIPNFGSIQILLVLPIILTIISFIIKRDRDFKKYILPILIIIVSSIYLTLYSYSNNINEKKVSDGDVNTSVSFDTQYDRVTIRNEELNGDKIRIMNVGLGFESATFLAEDKKYELTFPYLKYYDLMFESKNEIKNCLMIGGAGYNYPKYYISHYPDKTLDVVEIDGEITELAKKYFYLEDLIKEYNTEENPRLNLITEDGRTYINQNTKKYDAIMNDAFSGETPAKTLTTLEAATKIKNSLKKDGLYLSNIVGSTEGKNSKFIKAEVNTLKQVFKNVYVIPVKKENKEDKSNFMVISTDQDIDFKDNINLKIDSKEIVLTDNYAPVDTLIPSED